jgi:hypothetical protein
VIQKIKPSNGKKGNTKESTVGKNQQNLKNASRSLYLYLIVLFKNIISFPSYVVRISLCNILYYNSHSFELLLFFLFPFSHLHFFTCRHMPEIFVIWKFIVVIFNSITISYFFVAFYTLHFYQFVHLVFYSSLVQNITSFYLLKKCLPISVIALIFFLRYIYLYVYVCIYTSFSYTSLSKINFFSLWGT